MVESQGVGEGLAGRLYGEHVLVVANREPGDGGHGYGGDDGDDGVDDGNWGDAESANGDNNVDCHGVDDKQRDKANYENSTGNAKMLYPLCLCLAPTY